MLPNSILFPATRDLARHLHADVSFIGMMVTAYSIAYVLTTPMLGILSDHIGRKAVLAAGLALFAVGGLVPLVTHSLPLILAGRVVMGMGSAGILPMVDSAIGDMFAAGSSRRAALAGFAATLAVADALVPFLGGVLDAWHWQAVFGVYAFGFVASACCLYLSLPPVASALERTTFAAYLRGLKVACTIPSLAAALTGTVLFGIVYFGICSLLPMALGDASSGFENGLLFLPIGFSWVVTSAWLAKKPHLPHVHLYASGAGLALFGVTLWMAHAHQMAPLLVIGLFWGSGSALMTTMYSWVIGDDTPALVRGAMNALYNAGYVLGFSVGAPLFIALKEWYGYTFATTIAACTVLLSAAIAFVWLRSAAPAARSSTEGVGI
jgi:ACDE family multidrug resistance protein